MTTTTANITPATEFAAAFHSPASFVQALERNIQLDARKQYDTGKNSGRTKALVKRRGCTVAFLQTVRVPADNISMRTLIADLIHERTGTHKTVVKGYKLAGTNTKQIIAEPTVTTIRHTRDFGGAVDRAIWGQYTRIAAGYVK
jgi:hypothetical protein